MTLKLNLSTLVAILSGLGGVSGVILGSIGAGGLTGPVQALLVAVSGLLVAISGHHASSVVAAKAVK